MLDFAGRRSQCWEIQAESWQIVVNLVGNGIKFTERGEILVTAKVESEEGEEVRVHFTVKDTGVGIPVEKQAKVFEAFSQADGSMARRYGGTGLGLTICARLVEMMDGRIWVEGAPGGSAFQFVVKLGVQTQSTARNLHALIVNNNSTNRRVLQGMLNRWGGGRQGAVVLCILHQTRRKSSGF